MMDPWIHVMPGSVYDIVRPAPCQLERRHETFIIVGI